MDDALKERIFAARHSALRNALYHVARRAWLDFWSSLLNFLVIIAGAIAATDMLGFLPGSAKFTAFAVVVIGALQLVYDFGGRARTHEILQRRFFNVLADIEECENCDLSTVKHFEAEHARIAGDEPPRMRALDAISDNQATSALIGGTARLKVNWWQSLTRQMIAHNHADFAQRDNWASDHTGI